MFPRVICDRQADGGVTTIHAIGSPHCALIIRAYSVSRPPSCVLGKTGKRGKWDGESRKGKNTEKTVGKFPMFMFVAAFCLALMCLLRGCCTRHGLYVTPCSCSSLSCWPTATRERKKHEMFSIFMAALRSRCGHHIFALWFLPSFLFFSSPNLSRRRLDLYHTSTYGVALVRI